MTIGSRDPTAWRQLGMWAAAIALVAAGVFFAVSATGAPSCCDADFYPLEGQSMVAGGWTTGSLSRPHNYAYPGFLALLWLVGVDDRVSIGLAQVTTLYLAGLVLALVIARHLRTSMASATLGVAAICLLPAAAWSGYALSEALVAPILLLIIALTIAACYALRSGALRTAGVIVALGLMAGLAWMTRPALIWIPAVLGALILGWTVLADWRRPNRLWLLAPVFAVAALATALPQVPLGVDPFKFDLARSQSAWGRVIWRYASNLSGCGPVGLMFSPITEDLDATVEGKTPVPPDVPYRVVTAIGHVVSGWDPRPSPTYAATLDDPRWTIVAAVSGFVIVGALMAALLAWKQRRAIRERPEVAALAAILVMLAASQVALSTTATEFRFNLPGWLLAGTCLVLVTVSGWWTRRRVGVLLAVGALMSAVIFAIGQVTLGFSSAWVACTT